MLFQWQKKPVLEGLFFNRFQMEPDYQTLKLTKEEFELQDYIRKRKGWKLVTHFKIDNDSTFLCTYKRG